MANLVLGLNRIALVTRDNLVVLVTVLGDALLSRRVAIVSRLRLLRGSGRGGRLGVVGDLANDTVLAAGVKVTAVDAGVQLLEVGSRDAPAGGEAVAVVAGGGGRAVAALNTAAGVAHGAGSQQVGQKAEDENSLGIHLEQKV